MLLIQTSKNVVCITSMFPLTVFNNMSLLNLSSSVMNFRNKLFFCILSTFTYHKFPYDKRKQGRQYLGWVYDSKLDYKQLTTDLNQNVTFNSLITMETNQGLKRNKFLAKLNISLYNEREIEIERGWGWGGERDILITICKCFSVCQ